jgi:hypothetical protein
MVKLVILALQYAHELSGTGNLELHDYKSSASFQEILPSMKITTFLSR